MTTACVDQGLSGPAPGARQEAGEGAGVLGVPEAGHVAGHVAEVRAARREEGREHDEHALDLCRSVSGVEGLALRVVARRAGHGRTAVVVDREFLCRAEEKGDAIALLRPRQFGRGRRRCAGRRATWRPRRTGQWGGVVRRSRPKAAKRCTGRCHSLMTRGKGDAGGLIRAP